MDPTALASLAGSLLRAGLPALSTVVGAVVPPPYNLLSGLAFSGIKLALGVAPDAAPADVAAKVDADQPAAKAALQPVEDAHADAAAEVDAYLADVQNARATTVQLAQAGSAVQWGAPVVSTIAVLGFAVVAVLVMLGKTGDTAGGQLVLGAMIAGYSTVLSYWLGSSKGGTDRAEQIATMLSHQIAGNRATLPPSHRVAR